MDINEAFFAAKRLHSDLEKASQKDAEQEIKGPAIDTVDAVLDACRQFLPDHPIVSRLQGVLSPEAIAAGEPVRVVDVLPGVGQIVEALGSERSRRMPPMVG
jgi:hypothetical protein